MGGPVRLWMRASPRESAAAASVVADVFGRVEQAASRFLPNSALMALNRSLGVWMPVPEVLISLFQLAAQAQVASGGLFDPRILQALSAAGYGGAEQDIPLPQGPIPREQPWFETRDYHPTQCRLHWPVDMGGIGKGYALDLAAARLSEHSDVFLIEAGGDIRASGEGPGRDGCWPVAVEDPTVTTAVVCILRLRAPFAVATSSIARHRWIRGGVLYHHLIDPRTCRPADSGLLAVTVVGKEAAGVEVFSKTMFIAGRDACRSALAGRSRPALWVDADGHLECNRAATGVLSSSPL